MNKSTLTIILFLVSKLMFSQISFWENSNFGLPEMYEPVIRLKSYDYEIYQNEYYIKTTKTFDLKGKVKSIKEVFISEKGEVIVQYHFLENKKLTSFQIGDTLKSILNSNVKFDSYSYTYDTLRQIESYVLFPSYFSINAVHQFDKEGSLSQSIVKRVNKQSDDDKNVFDYTQHYLWNETKDSVFLKYDYKTAKTHYQRESNRSIYFPHKKDNTQSPSAPIYESLLYPEKVEYDRNGNIIKRVYIDNEIKSSYNKDTKYMYKYNEDNELTEILFYERIHSGAKKPKWNLAESYTIDYTNYDEKGNWTSKKIRAIYNKFNITNFGSEFVFNREITYYE